MKIVVATTYIYDKRWKEFTRNKTGFGMMVNDIFSSLSENNDVYLMSHVITEGHGEKVLKHKWSDVFCGFRLKYFFEGIKQFFKYPQSFKSRLRYLYYFLNKGYVRKNLKALNPDVVHIHGIGMATLPFIEVCEELKVKYVVTLHGLIGLDDSVKTDSWDKQLEKDFLIRASKENIPVTFISSGMKKRVEERYCIGNTDNIHVVLNGTSASPVFAQNSDYADMRRKFKMSADAKICVAIGNIGERKNQIQIVRALSLLTDEQKKKVYLFLCGNDQTGGKLTEIINTCNLENTVIPLGFVDKTDVNEILKQADVNIVASIDEGFGLSIIEAYMQGVPTVTFSDLDAVPDLYNENSMILAEGRSTEHLAKAIKEALYKNWNRELIKEYSENFSLKIMSERYEEVFRNVLNKK